MQANIRHVSSADIQVAKARQPLATRGANAVQDRPIARVPQRRTAPAPTVQEPVAPVQVIADNVEDAMEEMDVDRVGAAVQVDFEGMIGEQGIEGSEGEFDEEEAEESDDDWLRMSPEEEYRCQMELDAIRNNFVDEVDELDTSMVAEYADDIFAHMEELSVRPFAYIYCQLLTPIS